MTRLILYIVKLGILAAIVAFLAEYPGHIRIDWQEWQIDTSVAALIVVLLALISTVFFLYRLFVTLRELPGRHKTRRILRRHEAAQHALLSGLNAMAASDSKAAHKSARSLANAFGASHPLSLWLAAQSAQLHGDTRIARLHYERLSLNPDTAALGARGLIAAARQDGGVVPHLPPAITTLVGDNPWSLSLRFDEAVRAGKYEDAVKHITLLAKHPQQDSARMRRLGAALRIEQARLLKDTAASLAMAQKAYRLAPSFPPAVAALAQAMDAAGNGKGALKLIGQAWPRAEHPMLLALYRELQPLDAPLKILTRFESAIGKKSAATRESQLALGHLSVSAGIWGKAESHARAALAIRPGARVFHLLADIARLSPQGDPLAANRWLEQGLNATPEATWHCDECSATDSEWRAFCRNCNAFATLNWAAR